jgi:hypothetical protein
MTGRVREVSFATGSLESRKPVRLAASCELEDRDFHDTGV